MRGRCPACGAGSTWTEALARCASIGWQKSNRRAAKGGRRKAGGKRGAAASAAAGRASAEDGDFAGPGLGSPAGAAGARLAKGASGRRAGKTPAASPAHGPVEDVPEGATARAPAVGKKPAPKPRRPRAKKVPAPPPDEGAAAAGSGRGDGSGAGSHPDPRPGMTLAAPVVAPRAAVPPDGTLCSAGQSGGELWCYLPPKSPQRPPTPAVPPQSSPCSPGWVQGVRIKEGKGPAGGGRSPRAPGCRQGWRVSEGRAPAGGACSPPSVVLLLSSDDEVNRVRITDSAPAPGKPSDVTVPGTRGGASGCGSAVEEGSGPANPSPDPIQRLQAPLGIEDGRSGGGRADVDGWGLEGVQRVVDERGHEGKRRGVDGWTVEVGGALCGLVSSASTVNTLAALKRTRCSPLCGARSVRFNTLTCFVCPACVRAC